MRAVRSSLPVEDVGAALTRRMVEAFTLDTHALILDMTSFATFIDSTKVRAPASAQLPELADRLARGRTPPATVQSASHPRATAG
jgi:hypothetical protein